MDRPIEKKKWTVKKIAILAGIGVGVLLIAIIVFNPFGTSRMSVEGERITIGEAKRASFREFIPVTGIVQPVSTIFLDLREGGRVEEIFVEDGAVLKKDQPILRLSNTDLELSLTTQETSVYNLLAQMQIAHNGARQNTISKLTQSVDVESQLIEAKRIYEIDKKLMEKQVIAPQEYQETENRYNYLLEKKKLTDEILMQDSIASAQQLEQARQSYNGAKNGLDLMRRKFADLTVRTPVAGQLTSLDAEIGQNKNKGERIGQIDVLSGFKVRVEIDEHYIPRIYAGLEGVYKQDDSTYTLVIKKVYTQVSNGRFAVDMMFKDKMPENIRRGQSLQIRIALSDETDALLIPRGGFYQQTGGAWIFKLTADASKAYHAPIRIGRQNPDFYEVLEGLEAGDKVVVNSYENYKDVEELIIK
jgi:HlyD family secretion protein